MISFQTWLQDHDAWIERRRASEKAAVLSVLADPHREPDLLDSMSEAEILQLGQTWQTNALIEEAIFGSRLTENRHFIADGKYTSPLRSCSYGICYAIDMQIQLEQLDMRVYYRHPIRLYWRRVVSPWPNCGVKQIVACEANQWTLALARAALVAMKRRRAYENS